MSITLAPIALAHAESFHACLDAVAREKRWLAFTEAPPLEQSREFVARNVAGNVAQFVALDGERVVGWCDVLPGWADAVRHVGTLGLGLRPEWRGRGLGAQLVAACLSKAARQGITRVELTVRVDNERAIRLYERLGFAPEGRLRHGHRIDGRYHDVLRMALLLDEPAEAADTTGVATCVLCGAPNHCAMAEGRGNPCWCATTTIPPALLARVPAALRGTACICPRCVAQAHLEEAAA